ncbi:hypothetical protein IR145_09610, partial [Streptococcus danieliae]|nr:hypothetical protein [Streptococcus danieliae]
SLFNKMRGLFKSKDKLSEEEAYDEYLDDEAEDYKTYLERQKLESKQEEQEEYYESDLDEAYEYYEDYYEEDFDLNDERSSCLLNLSLQELKKSLITSSPQEKMSRNLNINMTRKSLNLKIFKKREYLKNLVF